MLISGFLAQAQREPNHKELTLDAEPWTLTRDQPDESILILNPLWILKPFTLILGSGES